MAQYLASREPGLDEWERSLDERERGVDAWSAVWPVVSADGAPGGFQAAFQCLARRRVRVARWPMGTGYAGQRAAWRKGVLRHFRCFFALLLVFILAFDAPLLRLSLVRSVIHFPLQP